MLRGVRAFGPDRDDVSDARKKVLAWSIVAVALALAAVALAWDFRVFTWDPSDDATYLRYARRVVHNGPQAFPQLFDNFISNTERWNLPPPSRVLHTSLAASFALIFGDEIRTLGYLSVSCHLALIPLTFLLARRVAGTLQAAALAALLASSPLMLAMAGTALSDSCAFLFAAIAVWMFLRWLENPRAARPTVALIVALWLAFAAKELSLFLVAPLAVCAWLDARRRPDGARLRDIAVVFATPCIAVFGIWALAAGGVEPLRRTFEIVLSTAATNPYGHLVGSGPWYRYLIDFLLLSPWVAVLAFAGLGVLALDLAAGAWNRTAMCCALLLAGLLLEGSFFSKNIRFLMILELPVRGLALFAVMRITGTAWPKHARAIALATVALLMALDLASFFDPLSFIYDPVTPELLKLRGILVE